MLYHSNHILPFASWNQSVDFYGLDITTDIRECYRSGAYNKLERVHNELPPTKDITAAIRDAVSAIGFELSATETTRTLLQWSV